MFSEFVFNRHATIVVQKKRQMVAIYSNIMQKIDTKYLNQELK